jgi:hypothetical protein
MFFYVTHKLLRYKETIVSDVRSYLTYRRFGNILTNETVIWTQKTSVVIPVYRISSSVNILNRFSQTSFLKISVCCVCITGFNNKEAAFCHTVCYAFCRQSSATSSLCWGRTVCSRIAWNWSLVLKGLTQSYILTIPWCNNPLRMKYGRTRL